MAAIEHIFTWAASQLEERKTGQSSMTRHQKIHAIAGVGLAGDRYAKKAGLYSGMNFTCQQVTLFDVAQYDELLNKPRMRQAQLTIPSLRRNIGLRCNAQTNILSWVGHEIEIGEAVLFVHMHGNPCPALEKTLKAAGFQEAAWDLCGVHAEVVQSGDMALGDEVRVRPGGPHPERITGPATLRKRINGAFLRPSLRAKLVPDLVCSLTTTDEGYINACHYSDSTGYLGSWPTDARPHKGPGAKALQRERRAVLHRPPLDWSHGALFLLGVVLACAWSSWAA